MFTYNTTKAPILRKDYGRNMQNLIQHIAQIPNKEEQTAYIQQLIPILQNIKTTKGKKNSEVAQLWSDAFIASNYKLNINAPEPLPSKAPIETPSQKTQPITTTNPFKCCGRNLVNFIRTIFKAIENNPNPKETILLLAKVIQRIHRKPIATTNLLTHIEQIVGKKIPCSHQEIEKQLNSINNRQKKYKN